MAKTKFMMSEGLGFSEKKDMERLRKFSLEGWQVTKFKLLGYGLEQGKSEDNIYSIDYRKLELGEEGDYIELFSSAGWSHVCTSSDIHLFKAKPGTTPLYSEKETTIDKYKRQGKPVYWFTVILVVIAVLLWLVETFSSGLLQQLSKLAFISSFIFILPAVMTSSAISYHKWNDTRNRSN